MKLFTIAAASLVLIWDWSILMVDAKRFPLPAAFTPPTTTTTRGGAATKKKTVPPSMMTVSGGVFKPSVFRRNSVVEQKVELVNGDAAAIVPKEMSLSKRFSMPRKLDLVLFTCYLCNAIVFTLPVLLLPMVAAERPAGIHVAGFCATVASVASLGGAVGKFLNGFVCQQAGGRLSGGLYLCGLASFIGFLSTTGSTLSAGTIGLIVAGMEFCCSIQWVACTVVLANHYEKHPERFAAGITALSLASTGGTLLTKIVGTALLQRYSWRRVAQFGSGMALLGALCFRTLVKEYPASMKPSKIAELKKDKSLDLKGIFASLKSVVSSRLFWLVGIAHAMSFLARTSDRVLGSFFLEATNLPRYVCGGLTASVTLGFMHGLSTGSAFHKLKDAAAQSRLLTRKYITSVLSALTLAVCANKSVGALFANKSLLAGVVALASGVMASSLSFQFYHLPPTVSKEFGKNKAVCLSFLDGMGWFLAAPIWALTSKIVTHPSLGSHGWSVAWSMLALCFAVGGKIMMNVIPPVLEAEKARASA